MSLARVAESEQIASTCDIQQTDVRDHDVSVCGGDDYDDKSSRHRQHASGRTKPLTTRPQSQPGT